MHNCLCYLFFALGSKEPKTIILMFIVIYQTHRTITKKNGATFNLSYSVTGKYILKYSVKQRSYTNWL